MCRVKSVGPTQTSPLYMKYTNVLFHMLLSSYENLRSTDHTFALYNTKLHNVLKYMCRMYSPEFLLGHTDLPFVHEVDGGLEVVERDAAQVN